MVDSQNMLDISGLPEELKQELFDFYQFLMQKYVKTNNNSQTTGSNMVFPGKAAPFKPLKRENIYIQEK